MRASSTVPHVTFGNWALRIIVSFSFHGIGERSTCTNQAVVSCCRRTSSLPSGSASPSGRNVLLCTMNSSGVPVVGSS